MSAMNDETRKVATLELRVTELTNALRAIRESGKALGVRVDRDYAGTLHVNLCSLIRHADKLRVELEEYYDLVSELKGGAR